MSDYGYVQRRMQETLKRKKRVKPQYRRGGKIILSETEIEPNSDKGVTLYKGCMMFTASLSRVMDMVTERMFDINEDELYNSMLAQVWGCTLLGLMVLISPALVVMARNAITTIQVRAFN